MKLTSDEFNELQRWMKVRDYCQEAETCLRLATECANGHNYDGEEYTKALEFAHDLEERAISKIRKMVDLE